MILDTDFLIALDDGEPSAIEKAERMEESAVPLRIPTIVVQELYVGVGAGASSRQNAHTYEALIANKPIVPISGVIARRAGVLEGEHLRSDSKPNLGTGDACIAATALQFDEPVVTDDEDFTHVDGLAVELL